MRPGNGYVAYDRISHTFYRIYVESYIEAVGGGVIGAEIKYQKPFKGVDEAIKLDEKALSFEAEGGTQTLTFTNATIIPFSYTSSADWCHVYTSSTNAVNVPNGIAVQVDPHHATTATEATVTLTTLYGRETTIKVVRGAQGPYVQMSKKEVNLDSSEGELYYSVVGNVDIDKLTASTDQDWCTASIEDMTDMMYSKAQNVRFIGNRPYSRAGADNNDAKTYRLTVSVTKNYDEDIRTATVTVKSKDGKASDTMLINQRGSSNYLYFNNTSQEISVDGGVAFINYNTSLPKEELTVKSDASWCNVELDKIYNGVVVATYEANKTSDTRSATVTLSSKSGKRTATAELIQQPAYLKVSKTEVNFDKNRNNVTLTLETNKTEWEAISSDESWCSFTTNGNQITIRSTEATEDRTATITFKNFDTTITVHQSKYAVGDTYNENGLEGTVSYIGDGGRWIRRDLGTAKWSTENVLTGANSQTDGQYNMDIIKKISGWEDLYPAFKLVENLNTNGITGWILPAGNYGNRRQLDFTGINSYFWSSTEYNEYGAYLSYHYNAENKNANYKVYAIHAF